MRFEDVLTFEVNDKVTSIAIDKRFIEVCEAGTMDAVGYTANTPVLAGIQVHEPYVRVELADKPESPVRFVVKISAVRKWFTDIPRFPDRTEAQFKTNEEFLRKALGQ